MLARPMWYFKQLFPLRYVSTYTEDGQRKLTVWRMWLGRCYDESTYYICEVGTDPMGA